MARNKNWRDLSTREKAPLVLRGIVQFALLAAALVDIYRDRRRRSTAVSGCGAPWRW
jgi:hypothetical protein